MGRMSAIIPNLVGATISSRHFRLRMIERLGSGVYGVVYLAHDVASPTNNPTCYAVKVVLKFPKDSNQYRFQQREIAYQSAVCDHPNVVKLHRVIEDANYMYLVMDYCPGGDLFGSIIDRQAFVNDDDRLRSIFIQLIDGLHSCHDRGVFHRDLKPENILMSRDDRHLYIADFGLASKTKLSASFGCGSSLYMSPECLAIYPRKLPFCTARSDIWALGVILTNLITGRCPWYVASPHIDEGFDAFLREGPSYLYRKLPMSRGASRILARIFVLDPARRITLNELRKAVQTVDTFFRSSVPVTVPVPVPPDHHVARVARRTAITPDVEADIADCRISAPGHGAFEIIELMRSATLRTSSSLAGNVSTFVNASPDRSASVPPVTALGASPSLSTGSSDPESDGPATPVTNALDPTASVSGLVLECAEEGRCNLESSSARTSPLGKKKSRSWKRIFHTVQKIRILA